MKNIFNPERYHDETMEQYKQRRKDCSRAVSIVTKGLDPAAKHGKRLILADTSASGRDRRIAVRAAGGIRQFKKLQRAAIA